MFGNKKKKNESVMAKKRKKIEEPEEDMENIDEDDDYAIPPVTSPIQQNIPSNQPQQYPQQQPYYGAPPSAGSYPQQSQYPAQQSPFGAPPNSPFGNASVPPNPFQQPQQPPNNGSQYAPQNPFGAPPSPVLQMVPNSIPPQQWGPPPQNYPPQPVMQPAEEIEEEEEEEIIEAPKKKSFFGGGKAKPKDKKGKDKKEDKKSKESKPTKDTKKDKPKGNKSKKPKTLDEEPDSDEIGIDEESNDPTDGKHISKKNDLKDPFRPPKLATQTAMAITWSVNAASFRGFMCFVLSMCLIVLSLSFAVFVMIHQDVVYLSLDADNRPTYVTAQMGAVPNHEIMVRDFIYNAFIGDQNTMQANISKASALMTPTAASLFHEKYWKLSLERMKTDNLIQTMVIQSIRTTSLTAEGFDVEATCARQWSTNTQRIQTGRVNVKFKILRTNRFTPANPWGLSIDGIEYQGS